MSELKASNANWVRWGLRSGGVGSDPWNFAKYVTDNGIKILGTFSRKIAPWVGSDFGPIQDLDHWRMLVQQAIATYGPFISAAECWNEPDLPKFHSGYMDGSPEHYIQMLQILHEELKAYNPSIPLFAGSVATMRDTQTVPGNYYGGYFLRRIDELGAKNYSDGYSFHLYAWFLNGVSGLYSLTDVYNSAKAIAGSRPVWLTEMGSTLSNEDLQAAELADWFTELEAARAPFVSVFKYYGGVTGLIRTDFSIKPSYLTFQEYAYTATPAPIPTTNLGKYALLAMAAFLIIKKRGK